jgi:glycosyl hydrolase family 12
MRTPSVSHFSIGLLVAAVLGACSSDGGDSGDTVPEFGSAPGAMPSGPGGVAPGPAAPGAGAPAASPGVAAPSGVPTSAGGEAPGTPTLDSPVPVPGASAPGQLPPATDGTQATPAAPGAAVPAPPPASVFTNGAWSGPVLAVGEAPGTTVTPASFDAHVAGQPFCIQGSVAPDANYSGVARLVFTLNQPEGSAPQPIAPQADGLAFTFTRTTGSLIRVELRAPAGAGAPATGGWCYAIPEVRGQIFVPYSAFSETCFDRTAPGAVYAKQPIESVSFNAPGSNQQPIDYNFCVTGIADATNAAAAPAAPAGFLDGDISGTLRESFQRAMVIGSNGKKYIVQNNGWGRNLVANSQQVSYRNNSFTITQAPQGGTTDEPLTFPSLYVGSSGFIDGSEAISTRLDDNLPIQISQIQSIQTRFAHNANNVDANATYDVWFSPQPPTAQYETAAGAFLMVWTYKPTNRNPIGNPIGTVTLEGQQWSVVAGPRGAGQGANGADANSPVISYVKQGAPIPDYTFDLNAFIQDAVQSGQLNGNLFLTDVFAGFEVWSGGGNLSVSEFTVDVQ